MRTREEALDEIVDAYIDGVDEYVANLKKLMSNESFNSDDMRELSDLAYQLASFADEQADEFERMVEH